MNRYILIDNEFSPSLVTAENFDEADNQAEKRGNIIWIMHEDTAADFCNDVTRLLNKGGHAIDVLKHNNATLHFLWDLLADSPDEEEIRKTINAQLEMNSQAVEILTGSNRHAKS